MARRYFRRKYYKRRTLSTRNIYSKRNAKSQANQIYTLNKKVNAIARANRPDTHILTNGPISQEFTNSSLATIHKSYSSGLTPNGNYCRLLSFKISGTFEYGDNKESFPGIEVPRAGTIRLVIWQSLASKSSGNVQNMTDLIDVSNSGASYELNTMRPFKDGVSAFVKILYDRTYTVSDQYPVKPFKVQLNKLMPMRMQTGDAGPRGAIYFGFVTSGLHWVNTSYNEHITCNFITKVAYNDDLQ
uniref:Putative capsid n=1 Tax=ssDNA virus sp. TaxID=2593122 RepID=A0A894JMB2_9VIRU|nr:putative capsid [ssDNA virus sp.]